uniref:Fimbrillin family protein n=1 Tax=Prevotella sp. GTC17262 TaxID=3236797 RepID=A0AB33JI69_9BACT
MKTRLFSILTATALTVIMGSCASDDTVNGGTAQPQTGMAMFTSETSAPANAKPLTRTKLTYSPGNGADAQWSTGDKIWVKDDNSTWNQSAAADFSAFPTDKSRATFALNGTYAGSTYSVAYTGSNGTSATQVTIAAVQTQSAPNNFDHAGVSGDCGVATATGSAGAYKFKLAHKAAYLCFQPRCMNTNLGPNIRLTKIVVTSTSGNIAGTYDFSTGVLGTPVSGGGNSITLNTANFPLDNTSADVQKNGAYMVIAPGNHTVNIDYYIKDPTTNVEGAVHKTGITLNCAEGTISDVTAWVDKDITEYPGNYYYMWDAQKQYWDGYEWDKATYKQYWDQPTLNGVGGSYRPTSSSDPRYYNESLSSPAKATTPYFQTIPNVNEITWYIMHGNPRWDADRLWTTMRHLYKGGMWFKKLDKIAAEQGINRSHMKNHAAITAVDMHTVTLTWLEYNSNYFTNHPLNTPPTDAEKPDFFYLPMLGRYHNGRLDFLGSYGAYWTSSGRGAPSYINFTASLEFNSTNIIINKTHRENGFPTIPFRTASSTGTGPFFE